MDEETLNTLCDHAASASHNEAIKAMEAGDTQAQQAYRAVRAAVLFLLANGLVTAAPRDAWPEYLVMDVSTEDALAGRVSFGDDTP